MNLTVNTIGSNLASLLVDSISIGGNVITGSSTHTVSVPSNSEVEIIISKNGFNDYIETIKVYNNDFSFDVMMVPKVNDINDPDYLKTFPYPLLVNDPCSYKVDYYFASNSLGSIEWYFNNEKINEGKKGFIDTCSPGNYQIKVRQTSSEGAYDCPSIVWDRQFATVFTGNTLSGDLENISFYLEQDTTTNIVVTEHKPDVSFQIDGIKQEDGCYNKNEEVVITPVINFNTPVTGSEDVVWEIEDPNGVIIFESTLSPNDSVNLILESLGVYKVNAKVVDSCGVYSYDLEFSTCNFFVITQTGCSDFVLQNKGKEDLTIEIQDIEGNEVLPLTDLNSFTERKVTFDQVSFYNVIVNGTQTENYLINNYCEIENCISEYIEDLLCEPTPKCDPCPDESDLNQMLLFQYTYFNKLHKEFTFNNFYTGLDQSKIDQITNIEQLAEKFKTFCVRRGCINSDTFKPAGEETWDWVGKGNNCEKTCSCTTSQSLNYYQTGPNYSGCKTCGS